MVYVHVVPDIAEVFKAVSISQGGLQQQLQRRRMSADVLVVHKHIVQFRLALKYSLCSACVRKFSLMHVHTCMYLRVYVCT